MKRYQAYTSRYHEKTEKSKANDFSIEMNVLFHPRICVYRDSFLFFFFFSFEFFSFRLDFVWLSYLMNVHSYVCNFFIIFLFLWFLNQSLVKILS